MCLGSAAVCEINRTGSTENTAQIRRSMQIRDSLPQGDTELSTVPIIQNANFVQLREGIYKNAVRRLAALPKPAPRGAPTGAQLFFCCGIVLPRAYAEIAPHTGLLRRALYIFILCCPHTLSVFLNMISRRHAAYSCRHRSRRNLTIDITDDT